MDMDVRRGLPRVIREMVITPLLAATIVVALPCARAAAWPTTTSPLGDHASVSSPAPSTTTPAPSTQKPFATRAPSTPRPPAVAPVTVYGAAGSFGAAQGTATTPTGQRFATDAISGWGFLPGQAAYFPTVGDDGTVLIANEPQTDNQLLPTARQMVVSSFDPTSRRFRNIAIPTSTGRTALGGPWPHASTVVGGADISDIAAVQVDGRQRIAFTSAMPYWGWDAARDGVFPTLGFLSRSSTGTWKPDAARQLHALDITGPAPAPGSVTAARKASAQAPRLDTEVTSRTKTAAARRTATTTASAQVSLSSDTTTAAASTPACSSTPNAAGQPIGDCHMPAELAQLPRSGHLAITQYALEDPSRPSGRISVINPGDGRALASYAYPRITLPTGETLAVHPREIDADPLGRTGDERFVVIFDAVRDEGSPAQRVAPFAIQEFRYDARRGTLAPTSAPVLSGDRSATGEPLGFETAEYDAAGSLWVAQSQVGTLQAGPLAIFHREAGSTSVLTRRPGCAVDGATWQGRGWGTTCAPDERIIEATTLGIGRSLIEDRATGSMVLATMSGYLLPVTQAGSSTTSHRAAAPVDLGLDRLADRATKAIGPRKGVLDPSTRTLWLPIQQLATTSTCALWPCEPAALDQWLYGVDLGAVIGPATLSRAAGPRRSERAAGARRRR